MALTAREQKVIKVRLERKLIPQLNRLFKSTIDVFGRSLLMGGTVPGVPTEPLRTILMQHYFKTSKVFSKQVRSQMPANITSTEIEDRNIDIQLGILWNRRAVSQTDHINATTQKKMDLAWQTVQQLARESAEAEEPKIITHREMVAMAQNMLKQSFGFRSRSIACIETQFAAESSKFIEVGVMVRDDASNLKALSGSEVRKRWDSMGDSKVRTGTFNHLRADGQLRPRADAFSVSGQFLMFPGDTSLGASMGNIAGCRCSSDAVIGDIILLRNGFEDILVPVSELPKPLLPPGQIPPAVIEG